MAIAQLIKYEGDNDSIVWKYPLEDFNSLTQLIVHESQEAVFFLNGQAQDLFGAGRYTLETENIPKIGGVLKITKGNPFHCEVYYVNLATIMGIKWGTDTKITILDPTSGMPVALGASGSFNLRVCDSRKLLVKLIGNDASLNKSDLMNSDGKQYFKTMVVTQVKAYLAQTIKENNINLFELDAQLMTLSEALKVKINAYLEEYGLTMPEFFVARVITPDDDPNFARMKEQYAASYLNVREEEIKKRTVEAAAERRIAEAKAEAELKILKAQGEAEAFRLQKQAEAEAYRLKAEAEAKEMQMKGYTYQQETSRMVGMEALQNGIPTGGTGSGIAGTAAGTIGDIAGLGMTLGALGGVVGMTKDAMGNVLNTSANFGTQAAGQVSQAFGDNKSGGDSNLITCPSCGKTVAKSRFCMECGYRFENVCSQYGAKIAPGSKFCPECGTKQ